MVGDTGPVIPGSVGDAFRSVRERLEALKRAQAERSLMNRLPNLPDDPGKLREIGEGTGEFLTGIGYSIVDTILRRPDGPEMRKLALSSKEYWRGIEKYAGSLKQRQAKWQEGAGESIQDILKIGDDAAKLYEAYQEYPFSDNFKDYSKDKEEAANKRDHRMSLINQAIGLYYWNSLKDLDKLKITDKPEFKETQHFLHTLKAKMSERAELDRTATEFETQARLAEFHIAHSQKRDREGAAHSASIQDLPDEIGNALPLKRYLKAGNVAEYAKQAEERATELENILEHVEKHRRETEAKIGAYLSKTQKRSYALAASIGRRAAVNGMIIPSRQRHIAASMLAQTARGRATANPIGNRRYKNIANAVETAATLPTPVNVAASIGAIAPAIANLNLEARNAEIRARSARIWAENAEARAENARVRAREAEARAQISKAYNRDDISDESAKDTKIHSKNIEKMEKEIVKNACLIEINANDKKNALVTIEHNLKAMRNAVRIANRLGGTSPGLREKIAKYTKKIEEAEIAKNSAIALETEATIALELAQHNIRDELQKEHAALGQEHNDARVIRRRANTDLDILQQLVIHQGVLEEILRGTNAAGALAVAPGLIELEKNQSQAVQAIEEAILNRATAVDIAALKTAEGGCRTAVAARRGAFEQALRNIRITEMRAAEALKRNAIHMERDVMGDADQALERLQKIKDNLSDQDDEGLKKRSKGHLFIDPKVGKFTIGHEAIWMSLKEVDGWEPLDPARPGQTRVRFRPDIVKIEIEAITREAQGGKLSVEPIYTKRLSERYFRSDNYQYTLVVPGNNFVGGGRREAVLTIIDLKKQDGRIPKPNGGAWALAEYTTVKRIPMEAAGTIRIKENHNNQSNSVEVLFSSTIETMPNPVINHAQALARRQGPGWSEEQKRHMCKLDLDRRVLSLPNGQEYSMDEFDWTETKWDEENGLSLQYKGPRELSQVNLLAAGSYDKFSNKLAEATNALKLKKRKHLADGIEWLKQAIKSFDENKINDALGSIQSYEGIEAYQSHMTKNELESPPKNRLDLENLREKKKAERNALTPKWVAHCTKSAAEMLGARRGYDNEVKDRIRAIHQTNPLSAEYVWNSHVRPEKYPLIKHSSSNKKQELCDEIYAANHLDTTVSFRLLEDPKRGPAGPASLVKNAAPNGLELLREYDLYKNKQDFANQTERQNVEHYVASIATEFRTNPNIHPYYSNQWYLEQAMAAASDGNFLGKQVNDNHIPGVSEYIRNLKQVDCPSTSDNSLAGKRQNDEYHWVTYLRNVLAEAERQGMPELLEGALPVAKWAQEFRSSNLELAEKALNLATPSEKANRILDDIHVFETALPWSEREEKPTVGKDGKTIAKPDGPFDPKAMINKSDGELALEAGGVAEQIYKQAVDSIECLIDSTDDPVLQKKYREEAVKMAMDIAKQAFEINKQDKTIQNQWQKLEVYIKEMNTQRWKDFWFTLAVFAFQQGPRTGADGAKKFMDEILKVIGQLAK